MGNSRLAASCHLRGDSSSQPATVGANGILGRIEGQYVSTAIRQLPPAATAIQEHLDVEIDAGADGRVRFFAERKTARHHRHSHYYWSVYRAEPVGSNDTL
ncbi:hypothetical protein GA566_29420 [Cupriavidus sp. SW-Y-13]|nr:hypothetical protein [Cupriavidus sp. SW-Y-13]